MNNHRLRLFCIVFMVTVCFFDCYSQNSPVKPFVYEKKIDSNIILQIEQNYLDIQSLEDSTICSIIRYGCDESILQTRIKYIPIISQMIIQYNGKKLTVPKRLYNMLGFVHLQESNSISSKLSEDNKWLFVFMNGGDGALGYGVVWCLSLIDSNNYSVCVVPTRGEGELFVNPYIIQN